MMRFDVGSSSILTHSLNTLLPLRGEDGEELLHNIVVRPISSRDSNHCLLQINDVTVAVTRERVLRERQNARYHAIVDTAPDAIITTGLDRTIQWVNGAAEHVFGYVPSELLGRKIDILVEHDDAFSRAFIAEGESGKGADSSFQVIGRRKQGPPACFEVSFARWRADDRVFITTIWRDVTERMAAEAALRESESRHRALLEALPQLVWTCGPDGRIATISIRNGRPTPALRWSNNWDRDGSRRSTNPDRERLLAAWKSSLAKGVVFDVDARLRRADGTSPLVQDAIDTGAGSRRTDHEMVRNGHRHNRSHRSAGCITQKQRRAGGSRRRANSRTRGSASPAA